MSDSQAEALRQNFDHYAEQLDDLQHQIQTGAEPAALPDYRYTYLDDHHTIHSFDLLQGEVGLLFQADEAEVPLHEDFHNRVQAMQSALGHEALEQIVAYAEEDELFAIVTKATSTYDLSMVGKSCLNSIPFGVYERLFATFRTMEALGLKPFVEYMDSIKYPDVERDSPMNEEHDLVVVRYAQHEDSSLRTHVLGLGGEMIREVAPGQAIPYFAGRYYAACNRYLGEEMGMELIDHWLRQSYSTPTHQD